MRRCSHCTGSRWVHRQVTRQHHADAVAGIDDGVAAAGAAAAAYSAISILQRSAQRSGAGGRPAGRLEHHPCEPPAVDRYPSYCCRGTYWSSIHLLMAHVHCVPSDPTECVPLISVTGSGTAMPSNASDLAENVGWLIGTWGVQLNHAAQTDLCVQEAIASFGQDPIALVAGRCRSRCEQTIDGCGVCGGTSYPTVSLEAGPFQSYRRGQDIRLATTVVWDNAACALSHEMVYRWSAQLDESVSRIEPTLTVPSNLLPPGGSVLPVLLEVGVVPIGGSLGDATSTFATKLRANVTILRSPLVARISGGSRDVPPFVDVVLNASSSVDLDGEAGPLLFFWTCREVLSNRPCSIPSVAAPVWSIAAGDLTPGM